MYTYTYILQNYFFTFRPRMNEYPRNRRDKRFRDSPSRALRAQFSSIFLSMYVYIYVFFYFNYFFYVTALAMKIAEHSETLFAPPCRKSPDTSAI